MKNRTMGSPSLPRLGAIAAINSHKQDHVAEKRIHARFSILASFLRSDHRQGVREQELRQRLRIHTIEERSIRPALSSESLLGYTS